MLLHHLSYIHNRFFDFGFFFVSRFLICYKYNLYEINHHKENDTIMTYEYNKDSIRTKKVVNGIETTYQLENNHILFVNSSVSNLYSCFFRIFPVTSYV